jgi:hypothetical protein
VVQWVHMRLPARALVAALAATTLALPSGAQSEPPSAAPAPAAPEQAPAAPTGDPPAATKEAPATSAGGYSWTDKPKKRRATRRAAAPKIDPSAPLATYPGFRMLPGGRSTVWVTVSRKVKVDVRRSAGRVSYVLARTQVGIRNNTNPLVTHYFDTPLSRAWLRPDEAGAQLVLELRENVALKHRVVDGPHGTMILQIDLPRGSKRRGAQQVMPTNAKKGQIFVPAKQDRRGTGARP